MNAGRFFLGLSLFCSITAAQSLQCNFDAYRPAEGLHAAMKEGSVQLSWHGEGGEQLRASFTIRNGRPVVEELAARSGGAWDVLGKDLTPDFQITTGRRRISATQRKLLRRFGIDTPAEEDVRKWNTFWDAPLMIPGGGDTTDLPRKPEEIRRASVKYNSQSCSVATQGAR